jgi:ubiquinone/menaquinone biosynthesis C-methylase UbiE
MTATATRPAAPDLKAIKTRQQATWASGDFSEVATIIVSVAEALADAADLRAGSYVLDVATGSGNAAIAAARLGCAVVGVDYVPALLDRGRLRAAAERLPIEFVEGDAESLPFPDASFDAVLSVYGAMFAPDHARAAAEIARVCLPDGRIGLASWTPSGFIGEMFRTISRYVPPPAGLASPMLWGTQQHLDELFGDTVEWVASRVKTFTFRFVDPKAFVDFFATYYGPTFKALAALDEEGRDKLSQELAALAAAWNRLEGESAIAIPADYLESVGIRRSR